MTQPPCQLVPRPSRRSAPQGDVKRVRRPEPIGREDLATQLPLPSFRTRPGIQPHTQIPTPKTPPTTRASLNAQ